MSLAAKVGLGAGATAVAGYAYWRYSRPPVVIVGGGVMGLSTAECVARSGRRVILLDAAHPIRGSWGVTRASHLRMEDPTLLRMSVFSIQHWLGLQKRYASTGNEEETLFYRRTGAMMAGPADAINEVEAAVRKELGSSPHGEFEVMGAAEASGRFPQLHLDANERLLFMPEGYTMVVPTCMACLAWAADRALVQREEESVVSIDRQKKVVTTKGGRSYKYGELILTAGPWTNQLLDSAGLSSVPVFVSNEQTVELLPKAGAPAHDWDNFPLFTWSEAGYKGRTKDGGCLYFYTTPHVPLQSSGSAGVKIGFHRQGPLLDTEEFRISPRSAGLVQKLPQLRKDLCTEQQYDLDEFAWSRTQDFVRAKLPGLNAEHYAGYMRCLYQMTPDMRMIVGRHPEDPNVALACGFSGSGFQFAPAVADALAALVGGGRLSTLQKEMLVKFDPQRFLCPAAPEE